MPADCRVVRIRAARVSRVGTISAAAITLLACHTGPSFNSPPPSYSIRANLTGLIGSGLAVQVQTVTSLTGATVTCSFPRGSTGAQSLSCEGGYSGSYVITVTTQPSIPSQTCVVTNGAGTIGNADVTNVGIACTTNASRFAFVGSTSSNNITGYSIDAANGTLTPLAQSPFAATAPLFVAVDPSGGYALVGDASSPSVSIYAINPTSGVPTAISGSPFAGGHGSSAAVIDAPDHLVYVTNQVDSTISGYFYNPSSGALTMIPGSPFAAGNGPISISMTPDHSLTAAGPFVYVANNASSSVSAYVAELTTGSLSPVSGSPFSAGRGPSSVAVDPSSQFVYVTNQTDGTVSAWKIDQTATNPGTLAAIAGSPFAAGSGPVAIVIDAYDRFVYVANNADNTVSGYTINPATGALVAIAGSPYAAGTGPDSLAVDNLGKFLFVTNGGSNTVSVYAIDAASGALTPSVGSPFAVAVGPNSIALSNP